MIARGECESLDKVCCAFGQCNVCNPPWCYDWFVLLLCGSELLRFKVKQGLRGKEEHVQLNNLQIGLGGVLDRLYLFRDARLSIFMGGLDFSS